MTPQRTLSSIDDIFTEFAKSKPVPGLAWAVLIDGAPTKVGHAGWSVLDTVPVRPSSIFRIASMTKSFTAAALLSLRDEGLLNLDERVVHYVPELIEAGGDEWWARTTLRHLVTMTAGLPFDDPWADRQQDMSETSFLRMLRNGVLRTALPGTTYEYSNLGYAILGLALSRCASSPYAELVNRRLLSKGGLKTSTFEPQAVDADVLAHGYSRRDEEWVTEPMVGHGAFSPMGGLLSTVGDIARWVSGFLTAFGDDSGSTEQHPLAPAARREMQIVHAMWPPTLEWPRLTERPQVGGGGYGLGLQIINHAHLGTVVGHGGGYPGFGSAMWWHPASGSGIVVLTNSTYSRPREAALQSLALVAKRPTATHRRATTPLNDAREAVEQLLDGWQPALARRTFASCVESDWGPGRLEQRLNDLRSQYGPFHRDPRLERVVGPASVVWWVRGSGARVRFAIRLSPEQPTSLQSITIKVVQDPSADLNREARRVVDQLRRTKDARHGPDASILVASRLYSNLRLGPAIEVDGPDRARFRLLGAEEDLELDLVLDSDSRQLLRATIGLGKPDGD